MKKSLCLTRRQSLQAISAAAVGALLPQALARRALADDGLITLAVAAPMTGNDGAQGLNAKEGADMAVAAINGAGGIGGKKLAYEIFDDQGSPKEAAAVAQRILDGNKF